MDTAAPDQTAYDSPEMGEKWLERIRQSQAEKREKEWRDHAENAEDVYSCRKGGPHTFNILHSNVETIVPAVINSAPVPDVRRRFNDPDPVAKEYAELLERIIRVQIDDNRLEAEGEAMALDAFLAGRGILRVRFTADVETVPSQDELTGEPVETERVTNERVIYEAVSWRDFAMGRAKRWADVPWIAFRHSLTNGEASRLGDGGKGAYTVTGQGENAEDDDVDVWEVWCKETRTVKFIRENDAALLSVEDDPLKLTGFFPTVEPVQPLKLTGCMTPVNPFEVYKSLADELDRISTRINKVMEGVKVRGGIAGQAGDIEKIAMADDNELVILSDVEAIAQTKGLDGAITWWPVESAINVLRELYQQRDAVKSSIYEITGISDIVRGASQAQETATAQQIKTQWGSLRIRKLQSLIQRAIRDAIVLTAEIIAAHFSAETMQEMAGVQITPEMQQFMSRPLLTMYRVDIETDSTIKADLTRDRQEMAAFVSAAGQFLGTVAPIVQQQPELAEPVSEIFGSMARQYNLGKSAEDALERMAEAAKGAAASPKPNPEADRMQADMQAKGAELQMRREEMQAGQQMEAARLKMDQMKMQADAQRSAVELEMKAIELQIKRLDLEIKRRQVSAGVTPPQSAP